MLSETHAVHFQAEKSAKHMVGPQNSDSSLQYSSNFFFHIWYAKWTSDDVQMYRSESWITTVPDPPMYGNIS